ncbi:hypothetical protein ES707_19344 [subsurface metagenome]
MRAIYHPETETVEVPVVLLERLDQRAARIQVLVLVLKLLIDAMKCEDYRRR